MFALTASRISSERLRACLSDLARLARGEITATLGELAMRRGFESDAQFSRAFKAEFGMTPSARSRIQVSNPEPAAIDPKVARFFSSHLRVAR